MSSPSSNARQSSTKPDQRLLGSLAVLFVFTAMATSSCVNCCPDERTTSPPEAAFVKMDLPGTAKAPAYATWRTKSPGRPILLLHALNGISPSVLHWALDMESWGYRVYIPSLYGDPIQEEPAYGYDNGIAATKFLADAPEWDLNSTSHPGPIIAEVRALAKAVSAREGNQDIAVIGNCLTGIFPLAIMDEPYVRVAVLSQPAMPVMKLHEIFFRIPQSKGKQRSLPLSANHLNPILNAIAANPSKRILGFHYAHDPVAPILKFDQLHETLDEAGLTNRFTAYVMEKPDSSYAARRPRWVVGETTEQKRKLLTPHSTLSNPESLDDRDWFRARLREELDRAWE
ncbi:MAG: hypothetical protein P1U58_07890 [Verrucomicrobiales bacterium]|nr:hypothetical protein [Verrucomicrobiales bacterium]